MTDHRYYVGLSASFHDPALAIVGPDGEVLFAEATERYLQDKRAFNATPDHFHRAAALVRRYCAPGAEIVAAISWSEQALLASHVAGLAKAAPLRALTEPIRAFGSELADHQVWPYPSLEALQSTMLSSLSQAGLNLAHDRELGPRVTLRRFDHHLCHAAYACHASAYEEAACAVVDGYGEGGAVAFFHWQDGALRSVGPRRGPLRSGAGSLGMFYSQLCAVCGFDPLRGEEWKVMGLAPYGRPDPRHLALLRAMLEVRGLDLTLGASAAEHRRCLEQLQKLSTADTPAGAMADLARSGQQVFGEVMAGLLRNLHAQVRSPRLVLAGGCALNSAYNGQVLKDTPFDSLFVPSAPGDDGNAIGAALLAWSEHNPRRSRAHARAIMSPYLGSDIDRAALSRVLTYGAWPAVRKLGAGVCQAAAKLLAAGRIIGWMQGRAEFGPRALGNRSVLADPRSHETKDTINARVKFRESFRPFAPSILDAAGPEYFESYQSAPYMERALRFRPEVRERVPAVVHVDGTGRLQSVRQELAPRYHALISAFAAETGVPIVLNTSFNVMGKPIVHSVEDAFGVFLTSGLDALVIDDVLFEKPRHEHEERR